MDEKIVSYSKEIIISTKPADVNGILLILRPLPTTNK